MRAGKRDRRIRLERLVLGQNEVLAETKSWQLIDEIWAEKVNLRGEEKIAADQVLGLEYVVFNVLPDPRINRLCRIQYPLPGGDYYQVSAIQEIGRAKGLQISCTMIDELAPGVYPDAN